MIVAKNKNILLALISFILATVIWMILSNNINPLIHERVSVPIEIRVDSELSDAGRSFSLPTENQRVTIDYYVRQDDVGKVSANDITAYVNILEDVSDFVDINYVYDDKRKLMHNLSFDKEKVYVTVDDMAHKSLKVSYTLKGRLANENLAVAYVSVEPNELFVNGPATEVDKVSKISFEIDVSGKDQNYTGNARPLIFDANGNLLTKDLTLSSNSVNYIVSINSTKTVSFTTSTTGNVAAGYSFAGITVNPSNITISATNDILSMVQAISIPSIDITGLTENKEIEYNIVEVLPRGTKNVSNNKVITVTVMVNNIRRELPEFDRDDVRREFDDDRNPDRNVDRSKSKLNVDPTASVIVSPTVATTDYTQSNDDIDEPTEKKVEETEKTKEEETEQSK